LDLLSDLEVLRDKIYSTLDPYIRVQIQKRGITIIHNTYTGFDTEYVMKDEKKCLNRLLSVQTAIQSRTLLKLPMNKKYNISYVHPLTSEITTYYEPKNLEWGGKKSVVKEMNVLNESLKTCVGLIRLVKFKVHDEVISRLIESFQDLESEGVK